MDLKKQKNGEITFTITIPWNDIKAKYNELLQQTAQYIEIKGFRKGKAPLELVEKQIDKAKIYGRVIQKLLSPAYTKFISDNKLRPLTEPHITPKSTEDNKDWEFSVKIVERPAIDLGNYNSYIKKSIKSALKNLDNTKQTTKTSSKSKNDDSKGNSKSKSGSNKNAKTNSKDANQQKQQDLKTAKLNALFDAILNNTKIEISDLLIEEEYKTALSKLINQLSQLKITLEDYAKSINKTVKELVEEYKKTAETNLKLEFALSELVKKENPKVDEKEIEKFKPKPHEREYLKYMLQKQKTIDKFLKL